MTEKENFDLYRYLTQTGHTLQNPVPSPDSEVQTGQLHSLLEKVDKRTRKMRAPPKNPSKITRMNEAVYQWFKMQRCMNIDVDSSELCNKALAYSNILKVNLHFTASRGWLTRFRERYGITITDIRPNEPYKLIDPDQVFVSCLKAKLKQEDYTPGQIYCVDESVLLWKQQPPAADTVNKIIISNNNQDKLTLLTCTNMDASHKLPLYVVGSYTEPPTQPGYTEPPTQPDNATTQTHNVDKNTPPTLLYRKHSNNLLTTELFTDWFHNMFVPSVKASLLSRGLPGRAVLILDNSPYHPDKLSCGDITAIKIPCHIPNKSLPSSAITSKLKIHYKTSLAEMCGSDPDTCASLGLRKCFGMLKEAWGRLGADCIRKYWDVWLEVECKQECKTELVVPLHILPHLSRRTIALWFISDQRPYHVPFLVPNMSELLDLATNICTTRIITPNTAHSAPHKTNMIKLTTSDYSSHQVPTSPPTYAETLRQVLPGQLSTVQALPGQLPTVQEEKLQTCPKKRRGSGGECEPRRGSGAECEQLTMRPRIHIPLSTLAATPLSTLAATPLSTLAATPTFPENAGSPDMFDPFSTLQSLLPNISPEDYVSKEQAIRGMDVFISYVEGYPNIPDVLKEVLYEYRKYAVQKL